MKTIHKYILQFTSEPQTLKLALGAELLTVQIQKQNHLPVLCLWVMIPVTARSSVKEMELSQEERVFEVLPPGGFHKDHLRKYIGTVQPHQEVYHVFELFLFK